MEDVRLGRKLAPIAFNVSVATGAAVKLFGADPNRTRIVLSGDGIGTLFVAPEGITPTVASGFALAPGFPQMVIDVEQWGRLVTGPWTAFAAAGTIIASVMLSSLEQQ